LLQRHPEVSRWLGVLRACWPRLLITVGLSAIFFGNQGFRSLIRNWLELRSLSREISALEAENAKSAARLKELRESDVAVEREVRKVGFMKPGEIEYRFDPPKK
jgi:cell division protein FtsB